MKKMKTRIVGNTNVENDLISFHNEQSIENWNKVASYAKANSKVKPVIFNGRIERPAFIYQNPNLESEYFNVVETYYTSLYIQIFKKYFNDNLFNMKIVELVNNIMNLRKIHKKKLINEKNDIYISRSFKIQSGCKQWLNYLYGRINKPDCICKCHINLQDIICDIGCSIMSSIFRNIVRNGQIDKIIYIDTDSIIVNDYDVSGFFKIASPSFTFHTEHIKKIEFFNNNIKKRKISR